MLTQQVRSVTSTNESPHPELGSLQNFWRSAENFQTGPKPTQPNETFRFMFHADSFSYWTGPLHIDIDWPRFCFKVLFFWCNVMKQLVDETTQVAISPILWKVREECFGLCHRQLLCGVWLCLGPRFGMEHPWRFYSLSRMKLWIGHDCKEGIMCFQSVAGIPLEIR